MTASIKKPAKLDLRSRGAVLIAETIGDPEGGVSRRLLLGASLHEPTDRFPQLSVSGQKVFAETERITERSSRFLFLGSA